MRLFKDDTTYDSPAMWIDSQNRLWKGPTSPDSTMHFARFRGFGMDQYEVWVLEASACPEDCVRIKEGLSYPHETN
jgi:hypothetical protein